MKNKIKLLLEKTIKEAKVIDEGKLHNLVTGAALAAGSLGLTSCEKPNQGVGFDMKTQYVVTNTQSGETKTDSKTSQGYVYKNRPTAEQLVIVAAYQNVNNENKLSNNRDKADFQLSGLTIKEVPYYTEHGVNGKSITGSEFYGQAIEFFGEHPEVFQKELDELKNSGKHPTWLGQTLTNFDAHSILTNQKNHITVERN